MGKHTADSPERRKSRYEERCESFKLPERKPRPAPQTTLNDEYAERPADFERTRRSTAPEKRTRAPHERKSSGKGLKIFLRVLLITGISVLVLAIAALGAYVFYFGKIDPVETAEISEFTDTSATFTWTPVDRADGYYIYEKTADGAEYKLAGTVANGATSYTVDQLTPGAEYNFYVTAFNRFAESKDFDEILGFYTRPTKVEITSAQSLSEGKLDLMWSANESAAGYCVQYKPASDPDYDETKQLLIGDRARTAVELDGLTPKTDYNVRICAYIEPGSKQIFGVWSDEQTVTVVEKARLSDSIDPNRPMVALTFDDGPAYYESGTRILDVLEQYNAKATFFMIGSSVKDNPDNVLRKYNLGMELGNHTWNHKHYGDEVTADDISKCSQMIYDTVGAYPTAFRSPGGMTTDAIREECRAEGLPLYSWSIDTADWRDRDAQKVYDAVMNNVEDGDIILMHEIYDSTAEAVEKLVPALIEQGYQLVTVHDLIVAKYGVEPTPGEQYTVAHD